MEWVSDRSVESRITKLIRDCDLEHVKKTRVFVYRSTGAKTRAYARIWGLGRIWQQALKITPAYVIEVISEKFDKLSREQQDMVLIHELLHIPKTFSGALLPHRKSGGVNDRWVHEVYAKSKK
ncbi:metallopeptidase [Candidatus Woesebacteria bacterium]|nr:metallopeptidase [Candidatus Woesebacteria bacterium]